MARAHRAFAYHPFVAVSALRGDPPSHYQVDFRVRSLVLDADEQLQYVNAVPMEIWIPPGYPTQAPLVRPLVNVFHPNISPDGVPFTSNWQIADTLADVIQRIGEYLAWRTYDPAAVVNMIALQWLSDNPGLLPLDARGDFSRNAGGEPLGRINRFGPATLEQMRRAMAELIAALSGEAAGPNVEQVRAFGHQTRVAMRLFLEPDIPAELRNRAHEFDQCALDLPASVPSWEHVRRLKAWAKTVLAESAELTPAMTQLSVETDKLSGLVTAEFDSAEQAAQLIPSASELGPSLLHLPTAYTEAAQGFATLRAQLASIDLKRPPNALADECVIARHLKQKLAEADDDVEFARHTATETMAALEPALLRARAEVLALRTIGRWREYIDLFSKAAALEQQIASLNSDAVGGYFVKSAEGAFGPFQLEQQVVVGATTIVVSASNGGAIEVRNAADDSVLGHGANGSATAMLPGGDNAAAPIIIKLAESVDEPLLQLEYACQQTTTLLPKLQSVLADEAESWCGRMLNLFAGIEAQQAARAAHRRAHHRWDALIAELTELSSYKARLATHFLLTRAVALVPRLAAERDALQQKSRQATESIAAIATRSSRHELTGALIVPPKYAKTYTDCNAALDAAAKRLRRVDARLKSISDTLRHRLASPRLCGRPEIPELHKMRPLSTELTDLAPDLSDDALRATVASLAALLNTSLIANLSPAPPASQPPTTHQTGELDTIGSGELPVISEGADSAELQEDDTTATEDQSVTAEAPPERQLTIAEDSAPGEAEDANFIEGVSEEQTVRSLDTAFVQNDEETSIEDQDDRIEF